MPDLTIYAGPIAIAVICLLILVEEAGVPLPMFPGDGMLVVSGIMMAAGQIPPLVFLPLAYVATVIGAMTGYTWSQRLGRAGLERLADRVRLRRHLDHASDRLQRTGSAGVIVGRLLPGTRVYTNLVAGASGMPRATYVRGLLVSTAGWLTIFCGLGFLIGVPAMHYLGQIQAVWLTLVGLVGVVTLVAICLRWLRPPRARAMSRRSRTLLLVPAVALDLLIAGLMGALFHWVGPPRHAGGAGDALHTAVQTYAFVAFLMLGIAASALTYAAITRLLFGATAGEALTRVSYRDLLMGAPPAGGRPPDRPAGDRPRPSAAAGRPALDDRAG